MKLRSTLTAVVASAALALASTAPVRADPNARDVIAFIAGLAVLGLIANGSNSQPAPNPVPVPYPRPVPHPYPVPIPPRPIHYAMPPHCVIKVQTRHGWEKYYSRNCLYQFGFRHPLPNRCEVQIRDGRGWQRAYAEFCLNRDD